MRSAPSEIEKTSLPATSSATYRDSKGETIFQEQFEQYIVRSCSFFEMIRVLLNHLKKHLIVDSFSITLPQIKA